MVASGPLLRERRDLVVRALARLLQAAAWAQSHPNEIVTNLADNYDIYPEVLTGKYEDLVAGVYPLKVINWDNAAIARAAGGEPFATAPLHYVGTLCPDH